MQSEDKSLIELEIQQVLIELDSNQILSNEERLELKDHFLCEVEDLTELGLREEEALLVAKKRFGVLEEVEEEYKKVKPSLDWLRYGIIGVVCFSLVKTLTIVVNTIAESFWMSYYYFDPSFVVRYIGFDVPLRFILILIVGWGASKVITKMNFKSLVSLWKIPIFYLLLEFVRRLFMFIFPISVFKSGIVMTMQFFQNSIIISYSTLALILLVVSYKMYKMKVMEIEYV